MVRKIALWICSIYTVLIPIDIKQLYSCSYLEIHSASSKRLNFLIVDSDPSPIFISYCQKQ